MATCPKMTVVVDFDTPAGRHNLQALAGALGVVTRRAKQIQAATGQPLLDAIDQAGEELCGIERPPKGGA